MLRGGTAPGPTYLPTRSFARVLRGRLSASRGACGSSSVGGGPSPWRSSRPRAGRPSGVGRWSWMGPSPAGGLVGTSGPERWDSPFVFSEAMLFFLSSRCFLALNPSGAGGGTWPPIGSVAPDPYGMPLFGTTVLLASGCAATAGHRMARRVPVRGSVPRGPLGRGPGRMELPPIHRRPGPWLRAAGALGLLFGVSGVGVPTGGIRLAMRGARVPLLPGHRVPRHPRGRGNGMPFFMRLEPGVWGWPGWSGRPLGVDAACWYWHFVDAVWLALWAVLRVGRFP
uniref:Cytochrome c oxidase subunit 3 n=1 Tax=Leucosolenia complicata TaxID=433461 RepID=A0A140CUS3_9METZ|nr:cytochrome c oxidase subunit 3 [Leucosolenia complicata]